MNKEEFLVEHVGSCKKVYIPKGYCTVFFQEANKEDIYVSQVGDDVCIENTSDELACQNIEIIKGD